MGKAKKDKKANASIPQKSVHLRLAYLHEATTYLRNASQSSTPQAKQTQESAMAEEDLVFRDYAEAAQIRYLMSQMKGVSRKAVIRVQREVKRSVCKGCDEMLSNGSTSLETTENKSKDGAKSWADVLVVKCLNCGTSKRSPVGAHLLKQREGVSGREAIRQCDR